MTREVKAWWETTSRWFQDDLDHPVELRWGHADVEADLLGDVTDQTVLELGCGGGQCSITLAERGAKVTGVDLSREQLTYASELLADRSPALADRSPAGTVRFVEGDITSLPFEKDSFDLVFNAAVFQWVGDLESTFAEVARVLRPGCQFVFSTPHPFFDVVDPHSHLVVDSYYDTGRQVETETDLDLDMVTYRHSIAELHGALTGAGFRVDRVLEPGTDDPDASEPGPWGETPVDLQAKLPTEVVFEATLPA